MRMWTWVLSLFLLAPNLARAQVEVEAVVPSVSVNMAPPPMRVEVQTARPSPAHVWIGGHWAWENNAHVWIGGHWAMPPSQYHRWVAARWVNRGGRWMYWPGHWQYYAPPEGTVVVQPQPGPEVVVQQAPPPEIVEVQPARPSPGHVWINGHWYWNGVRYQWAGGHWENGRGRGWERAHYERRGPGWVFVQGRWR